MSDKIVAELMALIDSYASDNATITRTALEQAIRRAVDWEHVATITPFSRGADASNVLDKTFPVGTALYARRQDQ